MEQQHMHALRRAAQSDAVPAVDRQVGAPVQSSAAGQLRLQSQQRLAIPRQVWILLARYVMRCGSGSVDRG